MEVKLPSSFRSGSKNQESRNGAGHKIGVCSMETHLGIRSCSYVLVYRYTSKVALGSVRPTVQYDQRGTMSKEQE